MYERVGSPLASRRSSLVAESRRVSLAPRPVVSSTLGFEQQQGTSEEDVEHQHVVMEVGPEEHDILSVEDIVQDEPEEQEQQQHQ